MRVSAVSRCITVIFCDFHNYLRIEGTSIQTKSLQRKKQNKKDINKEQGWLRLGKIETDYERQLNKKITDFSTGSHSSFTRDKFSYVDQSMISIYSCQFDANCDARSISRHS